MGVRWSFIQGEARGAGRGNALVAPRPSSALDDRPFKDAVKGRMGGKNTPRL